MRKLLENLHRWPFTKTESNWEANGLTRLTVSLVLIFVFSNLSAQPIIHENKIFDGGPTFKLTSANDGSRFINCVFRNYDNTSSVIRIDGADNIVIENCTFENINNGTNKDAHAIDIPARGNDISIRNCEFYNVHGDGLQVGNSYYSASSPYIGKVEISNCYWHVDLGTDSENFVDVKGSEGPILIKNNEIKGARGCKNDDGCTGDQGYAMIIHYAKARNIIIDGNTIYECNFGIISERGASGNPAAIAAPPSDVTIQNNVVYNIAGTGIRNKEGINHSIINNTVVNSNLNNSSGVNIEIKNPSGTTINKNNLTIGTGGSNNNFGGQGNLYFSNLNDAKFANPAIGDYSILSNSPAKDAGVIISGLNQDIDGDPRPQGSAYDTGADEFADITPPQAVGLWLEAECADNIGSAWEILNDNAASQDSYLKVIPGNSSTSSAPSDPNKQLVFNFSVSEAGQYTVYTRQRETGQSNDDSFWLKIDNEPWKPEYLSGPSGSFYWEATSQTYNLSIGSHTLTIGTRENNAQLDKIYITLNGGVPSGEGQAASNCTASAPTEAWLEAECASVGGNWQTVDDSDAAGGKYLVYPSGNSPHDVPTNPADHVTFTVNVGQAGTYYLMARIRAPSYNDDSFWVKVGSNDWERWWDGLRTNNFTWKQVMQRTYQLPAGPLTITFAYREDGTQLDKLYLTPEGALPGGKGETASNCSNARLANSPLKSTAIPGEAAVELMAYPNPAHEQLLVRVPASASAGVLVMTDLAGKQVRRLAPNAFSPEYSLDIQDVPAGMYLIRWQTDKLYTTKVLVEH